MPPQLAVITCLVIIVALLSREIRSRRGVSLSLWIPTLWIMIMASRPLSLWFDSGASRRGALEGSPLDRAFYLTLILASMGVVAFRKVDLRALFGRNRALVIFYTFLGSTILWSEIPYPSFKRWIKIVGMFFVLIVVLTEGDPEEAIRAVYARCACVLIPLSVLFIKYYPELGRAYTNQGGSMVTGVTAQKNSLGQIVMIFSLFLLWDYLEKRTKNVASNRLPVPWDTAVLWSMGTWLLYTSQSKTATMSLLIAVVIFLTRKLHQGIWARYILLGALSAPLAMLTIEPLAPVLGPLVELLGRDLTFTGRTETWGAIFDQNPNLWIGAGYWSFWDGAGGDAVFTEVGLRGAHNGYIEVFLHGGLIAVALLYILLITKGLDLLRNHKMDRIIALRFALLITVIQYNLTESAFAGLNLIWLTTLFVVTEVKGPSVDAMSLRRPSSSKAPGYEWAIG